MVETLDLFPEELEQALELKRKREQAKDIAKEQSLRNAKKRHAEKSPTAYRTISEVAAELNVATHVLRFWESKFPEIKPVKRAGGRRYFKPEDIELLRKIQHLLYEEGYTIKGVQSFLKKVGVKALVEDEPQSDDVQIQVATSNTESVPSGLDSKEKIILEEVLIELKELKEFLND